MFPFLFYTSKTNTHKKNTPCGENQVFSFVYMSVFLQGEHLIWRSLASPY